MPLWNEQQRSRFMSSEAIYRERLDKFKRAFISTENVSSEMLIGIIESFLFIKEETVIEKVEIMDGQLSLDDFPQVKQIA